LGLFGARKDGILCAVDTILFFASSSRHSSCRDRLEGIYGVARKRGWNVQLVDCTIPGFSLERQLEFWQPVGVIVGTGRGTTGIDVKSLHGLPSVFLDERLRSKGDSTYVELDSAAVGRFAAEEFLRFGFGHFAFVEGVRRECWSECRGRAFRRTVSGRGRGRFAGWFEPLSGEDLLERRQRLGDWLRALPKPCGIFAANDMTGEEVLVSARKEGLSVPQELVVIGVDDEAEICNHTVPTLSSIVVDFRMIASVAAEELVRLIDGAKPGFRSVLLQHDGLRRRESTNRLAIDDDRVRRALEFIRVHAPRGAGVNDVAAAMGVGRRQAENLIRAATGRTVEAELRRVRLDLAQECLRNPRLSIGSIASRCGWTSDSTLRRAFRAEIGVSLRDWRKAHGG